MVKVIAAICVIVLVLANDTIALSIKDSVSFGHNYEGDVNPLSAGAGNLVFDELRRSSSPETPMLGVYGAGGTGYIVESGSGILDLNLLNHGVAPGSTYIYFGKPVVLNPATGWTVEFRVKAISSNNASGSSPREGLVVSASGNEGKAALLQIGTDRLYTSYGGSGLIGAQDNSTDFVTYRMAVLPGGQSWNLYRNGELLSGYVSTASAGTNHLSFGDQTGAGVGRHQIDYLRFDTRGAFAPTQTIDRIVNIAEGKHFHRAIMGQNLKILGSELTGGNSSLRGISGGLFDDVYDWKAHEGVNPGGLAHNTLAYLRAARDLNSEPIITVNVRGVAGMVNNYDSFRYTDTSVANRATDAADMVRYVNGILPHYRQGDAMPSSDQAILDQITWSTKQLAPDEDSVSKVTYWEIGNEPEIRIGGIQTIFGRIGGVQLNGSEYRERYRQITNAMLAVDPTIKVGGASTTLRGNTPINAVVQDLSLPLDFIVYHPYDNMEEKFNEVWIDKISQNNPNADIPGLEARLRGSGDHIRSEYAYARNQLINAGRDPNRVEHILSEWNPMNWSGFLAHSSQAMVLASAESIFAMADLDIRAANIWGKMVDGNEEYPVVKLFRKMSEHMGDTFVDQYKVGNLHVYTVLDSQTGTITIWGLNFSDSEDASLAMSLENTGIENVDVMGMTLGNTERASSILDTSDLNPIDWSEGMLADFDTGAFTIDVPQASIRLLVIESAIPEPSTALIILCGISFAFCRKKQ